MVLRPLLPVHDLPARPAERGIGDPASCVLESGLHAEVLPEARAPGIDTG
ncbi:hypothetical protein [Streptomyces sp. NPDC126503]